MAFLKYTFGGGLWFTGILIGFAALFFGIIWVPIVVYWAVYYVFEGQCHTSMLHFFSECGKNGKELVTGLICVYLLACSQVMCGWNGEESNNKEKI